MDNKMNMVNEYLLILDDINEKIYQLISVKRKLAELKKDEELFEETIDIILDNESLSAELKRKKEEYDYLMKVFDVEDRKFR